MALAGTLRDQEVVRVVSTVADASSTRRLRVVDRISFAVAVAGAVVLVVGWWLGMDAVTRVLPDLVSMKANTALGFVLAGLATAPSVVRRSPGVADGLAVLLALLGAATLLQYVAGIDLGIDELLVDDRDVIATAARGRMGLNSALAFLLTGVAVPLVRSGRAHAARVTGQALAFGVLLLSTLALLGYLLGVASAVGFGNTTQMALHAAVLFIVHAVATLALSADVGLLTPMASPLDAGRTARQVLPALVSGMLGAVLVTELLSRAGVLAGERFETALQATLGLVASVSVVLLVLRRLTRVEARTVAVTQELEAVRSAFHDLHLRVAVDGRVLAFHGPAEEHGLAPMAVGRALHEVLPAAGPELLAGFRRARDTGARQTVTFDVEEDGSTRQAQLVRLGDGDVAVAVRDVTDLARARRELADLAASLEDQVQARTRELARTNRELERFAYVASHDLKEPLRMVTGFVSRIEDRYADELDDRGRQYIHHAVDGAERMRALIDGLLAYSRSGRLDPARLVATDLADLAGDVTRSMRDGADEVGGRIETDLRSAPTAGDPVLLRQAVQNLVANGLRFSRPELPPVVEVSTRSEGGWALLAVADNGIGIPPEHRDAVFEVFRRFSTDARHRGTGIGLSIVKQVVDSHGGSIEVGDAPGGGTCFTLRFPIGSDR